MFDTIIVANNYALASVTIGGMDTSDTYSSDAKIALLLDASNGTMEDTFHTLDCQQVFEAFADGKTALVNVSENEMAYIIYNNVGRPAVAAPMYHVTHATLGDVYVADIDYMQVRVLNKGEADGFKPCRYNHHIGFKRNDATGYFIEEVKALLERLQAT